LQAFFIPMNIFKGLDPAALGWWVCVCPGRKFLQRLSRLGAIALPARCREFAPAGDLLLLLAKRSRQEKAPLPHGPAGPLSAQICRAAPNSLRYAPFRQGARIQLLKSLRDARQILRASPMQKGDSEEHGSLRVASNVAALRACTS
jgi:hypothetical protein